MKKLIALAAIVAALSITGAGAAALQPGVFDPGHTGCPVATYSNGVLHLAKNCATSTNAAAGANITGFTGATFTSASFTLASTAQCNGGSPRFDVVTTTGTFFLGCNNVTPTLNREGRATYTFTAATIAAGGNQVPVPTGTIKSVDVLVDVQGSADLMNVTFNGVKQVPVAKPPVDKPPVGKPGDHPTSKDACKHDKWKRFEHPRFKNQGQCVSYVMHHAHHEHHEHHDRSSKH
jgi:hypothetical protein